MSQPYSSTFLENMSIRSLLIKKLLDYNAIQLHGSALCMDGEAYVFTAPSGTGKSTHARFWRETFGDRVWMINDDQPMIRIEGGKAIVYSMPWDGKHHLSRNASAPLKAVVWLTRGTENHIERISKTAAYPILLKQTAKSRSCHEKAFPLMKQLLDSIAFII